MRVCVLGRVDKQQRTKSILIQMLCLSSSKVLIDYLVSSDYYTATDSIALGVVYPFCFSLSLCDAMMSIKW